MLSHLKDVTPILSSSIVRGLSPPQEGNGQKEPLKGTGIPSTICSSDNGIGNIILGFSVDEELADITDMAQLVISMSR